MKRRDFLKVAGLGAGAVGAAAVARTTSAKAAEAVDEDRRGAGYRETQHVRKYYELGRF